MKNEHGDNLLFSAAYGNKVDNFQQLVDRGLDYNSRGWGDRNLMHAAADCGGVEMVRHLLSLKFDPNSLDSNQETPLHYAAKAFRVKLAVIEFLVENRANKHAKNSKGQTALHFAAQETFPPISKAIEYLIGKGLGINDHDDDGNTPLHLCKRKEVCERLIEIGADIQAKNNKGQTALHLYATPKESYFRIELIKYLISNGARVNERDDGGNTPLHHCEELEVRDFLIEMGADIHAKNKEGQTPEQMNPIQTFEIIQFVKYDTED